MRRRSKRRRRRSRKIQMDFNERRKSESWKRIGRNMGGRKDQLWRHEVSRIMQIKIR